MQRRPSDHSATTLLGSKGADPCYTRYYKESTCDLLRQSNLRNTRLRSCRRCGWLPRRGLLLQFYLTGRHTERIASPFLHVDFPYCPDPLRIQCFAVNSQPHDGCSEPHGSRLCKQKVIRLPARVTLAIIVFLRQGLVVPIAVQ